MQWYMNAVVYKCSGIRMQWYTNAVVYECSGIRMIRKRKEGRRGKTLTSQIVEGKCLTPSGSRTHDHETCTLPLRHNCCIFFIVCFSSFFCFSCSQEALKGRKWRNSNGFIRPKKSPETHFRSNQEPILSTKLCVKFYSTLEFDQSQSFKRVMWLMWLVEFQHRVKSYAVFCL